MRKSTINKILLGIIIFLVVGICVLLILIASRPKYINIDEKAITNVEEVSAIVASQPPTNESTTKDSVVVSEVQKPVFGKTSTKVNLREVDSSDARVLGTVEAGYEFEIIEVLENGWTKIKYKDSEAYISLYFAILHTYAGEE